MSPDVEEKVVYSDRKNYFDSGRQCRIPSFFLVEQLIGQFNILEAGDGAEGEEVAIHKSPGPDNIRYDDAESGWSGNVCSGLKTIFRPSHIPIILLTARISGRSSDRKVIKLVLILIYRKPFNYDIITDAVFNMLLEQQEKRKEIFS